MNPRACVSGVSGLCRVVFGDPAQAKAACGAGCGRVCRVCRVGARVRACAHEFMAAFGSRFFSYARTEKADKPDTPNTAGLKALFLLGLLCVGCVSGWAVLCRVGSGEGVRGHD
ncbi:conserved hypothetical protein [Pseudomonas sp. OF001]|nr:conserved hypothetical protein [Pseudomonas sp. OF001]